MTPLFRRKPPETARRALFEPEFACRAPGVNTIRVDYDPAVWVRCPSIGVDRTDWVARVLAAYDEDHGWSASTPEHEQLATALEVIADGDLHYTANFAMFPPKLQRPVVATIDVLDEELTLLEYGDPDRFLGFRDVDAEATPDVKDWIKGVRWASRSGLDEGQFVRLTRAHRLLAHDPPVHEIGVGFSDKGRYAGELLALFGRVSLGDGGPA
ncbi:MAG: hypothetical protein ACR2FG_06630 [Marmoricola sp.]